MDQRIRNRSQSIVSRNSDDETASIRPVRIWRRACSDLWRALPDIVLFELVFQALTFVALSPIAAWLFARFVATSGKTAIGNFDIARFLVTPLGLLLGTAMLTLAIALSSANVAGLFYIAYGAGRERRISYFEALRFVAARSVRLISASFLTLLLLVTAMLPFVATAGLIAWKLLSEHDINYYLELRPPEFQVALALGGLLGLLAAVAMVMVATPLVFMLPEALMSVGPVTGIIPRSYQLAKGNLVQVLYLLVGWVLAWQLASILLNGVIYLVGRALVQATGDRVGPLLTVLGGLTAASSILNFALVLLGVAIGCGLLAQMYLAACRGQAITSPTLGALPPLDAHPLWSVPRRAPLALSVIAIAISAFVAYRVLNEVRWDDRVDISAHRGASLAKPENTAGAIQRAIEDGATYVEIDVQLTSDGRVVLVHDADMKRLAHVPLVINQSTFDELRALTFSDERVASLEEAIDLARGRAKLIVELKTYGSDPAPLIEAVVALLRERDMLQGAVVMSLEYREALATKQLEPRLSVGFVSSATLGDLSRLEVDFLAVIRSQATNALVAAAHAQGKQIFVWTIDDRRGMTTMIDRGVDNIITNDPALLAGILRERRELDPAERLLLRFRSLYVD